jgi:hypothetical protein
VAEQLGIADPDNSRGVLLSDLDNDGDLDAVITNQHGPVSVYRNTLLPAGAHARGAIDVRLRGDAPNTDGFGARVTLKYTDVDGRPVEQVQQKTAMGGFESQNDPRLHFGVGAARGPFDVEVEWPRGSRSGAQVAHPGPIALRESPAP